MPKYKYGWKQQPRDDRDLMYSVAKPTAGLSATSDLRDTFPPCYDQLQTSSCTGNGTVGALQSAQTRAQLPLVMLSRLFAYFNGRVLEAGQDTDGGANIRDVIKSCNLYGIVEESLWPFDPNKVTTKPSDEVYEEAIADQIHFYAGVDLTNPDNVKIALCHGIPVVFGVPVYSYMESDEMAKTGILQMPAEGEQPIGGHCMVICGHDDSTQLYWVRNSWGPGWSIFNGYLKIPYNYISQLGSDGWAIRLR